jgi:broad specificity polyphosphatase/5'/3'-nucleotidase SurE
MTTTVTVKTTDWPASVEVCNNYTHSAPKSCSSGWSTSSTFQEANTEQNYSATDTCSVTVRELPKDAVDLNYHEPSDTAEAG